MSDIHNFSEERYIWPHHLQGFILCLAGSKAETGWKGMVEESYLPYSSQEKSVGWKEQERKGLKTG